MHLLLDNNVPIAIARYLPGHEVTHASSIGWPKISNGELIAAAEKAGFEALLTADQNIQYQQNLAGRHLMLVVLTTNHWNTIRDNVDRLIVALENGRQAAFIRVEFPVPVRRRRPSRPSLDC
jgi:predicted nuclease of predicted toxin-antitoxin system